MGEAQALLLGKYNQNTHQLVNYMIQNRIDDLYIINKEK